MAKTEKAKKKAAKAKTAGSKAARSKTSKSKSTSAKAASAKKSASKKPATKKPASRKTAAKKTASKKSPAKKTVAKKTAAKKKVAAKKVAAKKPAAKKTAARKSATKASTKSAANTASKTATKTATKSATKPAATGNASKPSKPAVKGTAAKSPAKKRMPKRSPKKDIKTLRRKSGKLVEEDKVAGVGDKTVQSKTGHTWSEWFKLIDKAGGKDFDHRSIARYLYDTYPDLSSWWSQMITVGYEQTRGKRDKYQRMEGYAVNASKTIAAPVAAVYSAWMSAPKRAKWLPKVKFKVSTKHENKTLRLEWTDKITRVDVHFYERGMGKSQITVQHRKLPDAKKADELKTYWRERLAVLASQMRGNKM